MANNRLDMDGPRAAAAVRDESSGALMLAALEELQWQMARRDEITGLPPSPDSDFIEKAGRGAPRRNEGGGIRISSEHCEANKMSTLRDKLNGFLVEAGIEKARAIRVVFDNGDTVLVVSQDNPALHRTDPIQKVETIQSAEAGLPLVTLQNVKIKIYQESGHKMPHIHIDYGRRKHVASFSIETGERIIKGTLSPKYDPDIRDWLSKHKDKVLTVLREMQAGRDPRSLIKELQGA